MRKEVILAIILGVSLGAVIIYGIQVANQSALSTPQSTTPTPSDNSTPPSITPTESSQSTLTIISPVNNTVSQTETITITGSTLADSTVAIVTETDNFIVSADSSGSFQQEIKLISGENIIKIAATTSDSINQTELTIIFTTAKIN